MAKKQVHQIHAYLSLFSCNGRKVVVVMGGWLGGGLDSFNAAPTCFLKTLA